MGKRPCAKERGERGERHDQTPISLVHREAGRSPATALVGES